MRIVWSMALLGMLACTDAGTEKSSTSDGDGTTDDITDGGTTDVGTTDSGNDVEPCDEGLEVGLCPPDISFIDSSGAEHVFSDYRGGPVLILGTAEW